ncbi:serine/threonine-protein kinase [Thermoactinospora rubra]|uniref:serine/threonine-protein kinase n=1 Tax=Thermoactinospora rubra TaxID=1088767 RepID=UPI000A10FA08|nr:serine/threonine-protein kinase [Thermoactinospora rubra]
MQPADDAPGYRVLDEAGRGGFAVVYRAYQERLDRIVALKVLSVDRVDQRTMRRFQRELQLAGRLTGHPNVVTVFDTGMTRSGKPYIAMDYCDGGSLRDRVSREGALPLADVLRAGVKLAGALAAIHEAGVLHGDIKPQNILVSRYGEPAIADFGVARVVDSSEISATSQAFTPLHAAPEVLSGQPHSASTDIYSLGSTLYHLLAGRPAFHDPTDSSIAPLMFRVLSNEPPPIGRPDVPPAASEAILRAMAKQPRERYGTARAFAQRLQRVQAELGLPVTDLIAADRGPGSATVPRKEVSQPPTTPSSPAPTTSPGSAAPAPPTSGTSPGSAAPFPSTPIASPGSPTPFPDSPVTAPGAPGAPGRPGAPPGSFGAPDTSPPGTSPPLTSPAQAASAPSPPPETSAPSPQSPWGSTGDRMAMPGVRDVPGTRASDEAAWPGRGAHAPRGAEPLPGGGGQPPASGASRAAAGDPLGAPVPVTPAPPTLPPRASRLVRATPGSAGPSSGRLKLVVGASLAAAGVVGAAAVIFIVRRPDSPPARLPVAGESARPSRSDPAAEATIDPQTLAALKPRRLRVVADHGSVVSLRWALPAAAREYPLVLQREPADGQPLTTLESGSTTARVVGLSEKMGYCFVLGVPLRISESSAVAWSDPLCIRGAVPRRN